MKRKVLFGIAVLAIAAIAALNVNLSLNQESEMSVLALANLEALAQNENNDKDEDGNGNGDKEGARMVTGVDRGKEYKCIDDDFYEIIYTEISCIGSGNLPCTAGIYASVTHIGDCKLVR